MEPWKWKSDGKETRMELWMKVGEEHLGDSGGLCTKPISRRGGGGGKEEKKAATSMKRDVREFIFSPTTTGRHI